MQSISSARRHARAQAKQRIFHTINYTPRVSHFDPASDYRDFKGFFVLFWISLTFMVLTTFWRNIKDTGYPLRVQVWKLLSANVIQLAFSDVVMVLSTAVTLPLHKLIRNRGNALSWWRWGCVVQSMYQGLWLALWVKWPFTLQWTWTAQVFFILHTLVLLMKMHSYAFYNGHLCETEKRLKGLDKPKEVSLAAVVRYPSSPPRKHGLKGEGDDDGEGHETIEQQEKKAKLEQLRVDLATELTSPLGHVTYPENITTWNYCDFILCPTLCYELEYPRTPCIQWLALFWKTLAVFGCIFLLTLTSEEFIMPVLADAAIRLHQVSSLLDMGLIMAETISMLLFPFMITFLLVFLVIFEYLLGAFAEITCFADRHFYSDWWNSSDWMEFSREWNIPVHHFLRRHVYFASRTYVSSSMAMVITFLISSLGHELIMGCITKKLRGYGFVAMMLQLPIVAAQQSKLVRGRWVFNNSFFWVSMISGLAVMCTLYVLV
jgi:sterol O-acyltransferase